MGSIPTQTLKADLNGTGTLVDITAYVSGNGFEHQWGRTDWTSAVQPQGTLNVSLENLDGRFTPGSTATYARGVTRNMCVEWTCGSRVRRFYVLAAGLAFPESVAGKPLVTLQCVDALALLAARPMRAMVRETTAKANPVGFWPLDEASSAGLTFRDISGSAQPAMLPFTKDGGISAALSFSAEGQTDYIAPGNGRGPRTDGAGAVTLNAGQPIAAAINLTSGTPHTAGIRNLLSLTGNAPVNRITIAPLASPLVNVTAANPTSGWNDPAGGWFDYIVSCWFSLKDFYPTASSTGTDGPYAHLFTVNGPEISIMLRLSDWKLVAASRSAIASIIGTYSVSRTDVHHLAIVVRDYDDTWNGGAFAGVQTIVKAYLDGALVGTGGLNSSDVTEPVGITWGTLTDYWPTRTGSDQSVYAFSGSVSSLSIHGPDQVPGTPSWAGTAAADIWATGTTGPVESASARFSRIGSLATNLPATLAYSPQGTPQAGLLGPHDTGGKDALTVLCETLACEEASLDTIVSGGVDTVRAWLDSTQRSLTPALTVDVQDDAAAAPELGFDLSGVVASASAKGWNQTATWVDSSAAAQWRAGSATVASAVVSASDLLALAQYRTVKGRVPKISPTKVLVDAAGSKANLTATLLGLYPGATVRVQTMPSSKVGYSSIDCILVGCRERHGLGTNAFELTLIPRGTELYTDPLLGTEGPWRLVDSQPWSVNTFTGYLTYIAQGGGQFMRIAGSAAGLQLSSSATTAYLISNVAVSGNSAYGIPTFPEVFFSTDAADYPVSIRVDNEIITLPNPPAAPIATNLIYGSQSAWSQTVTGILRGQQGTTAATHGPSNASAWNTSPLTQDQGVTVVVPDEYLPLAAF